MSKQRPFEDIDTSPVNNTLAVDVRRLQHTQLDNILHSVPEYRDQMHTDPYFHKSIECLEEDCSPESVVNVVSFLCKTIAEQQELLKDLNDRLARKVMI